MLSCSTSVLFLLSAGPAAYIMIGRGKNFFEKYLDGTYMQKQSAQIYKVDVNMLNLSLFYIAFMNK